MRVLYTSSSQRRPRALMASAMFKALSKYEACFTCKDPTFTCFRQSEWYYGCMPEQPPAPKPPAPGDAVARWAACGGMNTPGCGKDEACFTCGDPTFSCDRQSEWYWGCRPAQGRPQVSRPSVPSDSQT